MENWEDKHIIFFDGDCGVCNFWVQWILQRDRKNEFMFASLQSDFGQKFLGERQLDRKQFNTLYLWKAGSYYLIKSKAILKVLHLLGGLYKAAGFAAQIFPTGFSDQLYNVISRNRMKISNQKCFLPTPEERKKFIEV
ncbi:thiol-disulfide oxidoreductase [Chryseobacterium sp. Leaf404]|uniref:thiol-disulfide oxidoreductase DCC family protein n=1 Tax=unclassified Chryseobacterium TaxID=2593645 RepID=UPI0006FD1388|nr:MULTISPECIES: DUF393 domain-containing protein [unclassified Chryseobacterium]KQT16356.1 thiol-disulfide oxidoreductase [Chryseobacterium sp. Leaf404]